MLRLCAISLTVFLPILYVTPALATLEWTAPVSERQILPQNFTLTFTRPVDVGSSVVRVFGRAGEVHVPVPVKGSSPSEMVIPIAERLEPGHYIVYFEVSTTDGHRFRGSTPVDVPGQDQNRPDVMPVRSSAAFGSK